MPERAILTAAPVSEALALADLQRALTAPSDGPAPPRRSQRPVPLPRPERLADGVLIVSIPAGFADLASALQARPPIFLRHVQPVHREVSLTGEAADLDLLAATAAELAAGLQPEMCFSVQTRILLPQQPDQSPATHPYSRFEVNERLAAVLSQTSGARLDVRNPEQVLSVLLTTDTGYLGLSRARDNLSPWAGGEMRFAREPDQISRSEFKLLEALRVFGLELPPAGRALDLGAAPGGWTRLLRRAGPDVTAVDPGELDPRLGSDPGIRHVRTLAQEYRCRAGEFSVIVNDMRMDARDSARLMLDFAPCLSGEGWALLTLKLPQHAPEQVAHQSIGVLHRRYELLGARQLFHNRSEITVALKRRVPDDRQVRSQSR